MPNAKIENLKKECMDGSHVGKMMLLNSLGVSFIRLSFFSFLFCFFPFLFLSFFPSSHSASHPSIIPFQKTNRQMKKTPKSSMKHSHSSPGCDSSLKYSGKGSHWPIHPLHFHSSRDHVRLLHRIPLIHHFHLHSSYDPRFSMRRRTVPLIR